MTLVSAVITTHKRSPEIVERALKSVLAQTYAPIEVTVVDDSPSDYAERDAVRTAVEKYADRKVKYIPHEKCMGACAARNTGLAASSGEYIAFLDDDDEWKSEKIEKQLKKFMSENIALVYCGSETLFEASGKTVTNGTVFKKGSVYGELLKKNFIGSTSFPLIRKSALEKIGGFDVLMQSAQDYDVWLRLSTLYDIDYVEEALVTYHWSDSEQISKNPQKKISGLERINLKNKEGLEADRTTKYIRRLNLAPEYSAAGEFGKAMRIWGSCAALCPWKVRSNLSYLRAVLKRAKKK